MSDLKTIQFRSFLIKREHLREEMKLTAISDHLQTLSSFLFSARESLKISGRVDEILHILHQSAVRNNDIEAIGQCEVAAKEILEIVK